MRTPYTLDGTSVLYEGREELKHIEVSTVVMHALRRKLRLGRYDRNFFASLDRHQEAAVTWNAVRRVGERDDQWVTLHAWALGNGSHHLHCIGPQAEHIIDKINRAIFDKTPKWLKKKIKADERRQQKSSRFRKRKKKRDARTETPLQAKKPKKGPKYVSSHSLENLTPQFRKSRIFWNEALDATVAIFGIHRDSKHSAREIAARRLYNSLERTEYTFAQYKQGGFCLQFTIVDGRWKGMSLTAATVSCTKDNRHPTYRRMRRWLRRTLHGLPAPTARRRHEILFDTTVRIAA